MELSTEVQSQVAVVSIVGDIDAETSGKVIDYLRATLAEDWTTVIIDLGAVEFMSSAGLRAILDAHRQSKARESRIILAAPRAGVLKVLKTAGFTRILACYSSVEEAMTESSSSS